MYWNGISRDAGAVMLRRVIFPDRLICVFAVAVALYSSTRAEARTYTEVRAEVETVLKDPACRSKEFIDGLIHEANESVYLLRHGVNPYTRPTSHRGQYRNPNTEVSGDDVILARLASRLPEKICPPKLYSVGRPLEPVKRYFVGSPPGRLKIQDDERPEIGDARIGGPGIQLANSTAPISGCSGCVAGLPPGLSLEASAFTGSTFAKSFGSDFDTAAFGGRFAAGFQFPQNVRFQADFEGEGSGAYCLTCGSHDYFAGAGHVDWSALPNFEFGAFGGAQYARPTFGAPTSNNGFGGVEGRIFVPYAVFGGNAGYFDVSSGPGTLQKAWFAEGRAKFDLTYLSGAWKPRGPTLEFGGGYASGKISGFLNNGASSAGWHATLAAPILDTPVQGFLRYLGHTNHVDGLGTVWTEHAVVGGLQINLGCQCQKSLEPMMPLPFVLRTVTTF
jgi:hypothetical protein